MHHNINHSVLLFINASTSVLGVSVHAYFIDGGCSWEQLVVKKAMEFF